MCEEWELLSLANEAARTVRRQETEVLSAEEGTAGARGGGDAAAPDEDEAPAVEGANQGSAREGIAAETGHRQYQRGYLTSENPEC